MCTRLFFVIIVAAFTSCADPAEFKKQSRLDAIEATRKSDSIKLLMDSMSETVHLPSYDTTILKIYVNQHNQITVNHQPVTITGLDTMLNNPQSKISMVYYSRYNAQAYEGPEASLKVLDLVIRYKLPLRFYTDSTFTVIAPMN